MEYHWPLTLDNVSKYVNEWPGGKASGRVVWAMMAANGLAYLLDIDDEARRTPESRSQGWQAVHMAHTRWAAASAVTALDLAAAALGRLHLDGKTQDHEYSLSDFFAPQSGKARREALTPAGRRWVESTNGNGDYRTVRRARNPLVHGVIRTDVTVTLGSLLPAHFYLHVGPGHRPVEPRSLIELVFRVVDRRLGAFPREAQSRTLWQP